MPDFDAAAEPFLRGIFAPTQREVAAAPLRVVAGQVPSDLGGTYYRNGPNPRFTPIGSYTFPLDGDGMVHAVRFADGRATYSNRYVRTPAMTAEERAGRALWGGVMTPTMPSPAEAAPEVPGKYKDLPDINVVRHAGRLLALAEGSPPFELADDLATIGPWTFGGGLPGGITAHPKLDPETGELVVFRYGFEPPFLTWAIVGADGRVTRPEQPLDVDASYMIHDFAITRSWIVLFVCPARFDFGGGAALRWEPERGTRMALVPRDGGAVRWIHADAFWVWHFANAFEHTDASGNTTLVVDYARWSALPMGDDTGAPNRGGMVRARLDPAAATAQFDDLDDLPTEFPRIDDRRIGREHRYVYAASRDGRLTRSMWNVLRRYDMASGATVARTFGETQIGEAVFIPAGAGENDGYVVTYQYVGEDTNLVLLRAADIAGEPVAVLRMPQRVPFGLHGCWVPAG
jgi:carotenoid cleavage dioxygenase